MSNGAIKYRVTPNPAYNPEHVSRLLVDVGCGPVLVHPDRSVTALMSDAQLDDFNRRGGVAHLVQPEGDPVAITPPAAIQAELDAPTVEEVIELVDDAILATDTEVLQEPEEEEEQKKPKRRR